MCSCMMRNDPVSSCRVLYAVEAERTNRASAAGAIAAGRTNATVPYLAAPTSCKRWSGGSVRPRRTGGRLHSTKLADGSFGDRNDERSHGFQGRRGLHAHLNNAITRVALAVGMLLCPALR